MSRTSNNQLNTSCDISTISSITSSTLSFYSTMEEPTIEEPDTVAGLPTTTLADLDEGIYRIISKDGHILSVGSEYAEAFKKDNIKEERGGVCRLEYCGGERILRMYRIANADGSKALNVVNAFGNNFIKAFGFKPVGGEISLQTNDRTWENHRGFKL